MIGPERPDADLDAGLRDLLVAAYSEPVDIDTAARHLWHLHMHALRQRSSLAQQSLRLTAVAVMAFAALLGLSGTLASIDPPPPAQEVVAQNGGHEDADPGPWAGPPMPFRDAQARAHIVYGQRRIAQAEFAVATRPQVITGLVEDAVGSVERAERIAGRELAQEIKPARETMGARVSHLASNPNVDDASRAKLMVYSVRLTGSGEGEDDPVLVTRRRERLADATPTAEEPAEDGGAGAEAPADEPAPQHPADDPVPAEPARPAPSAPEVDDRDPASEPDEGDAAADEPAGDDDTEAPSEEPAEDESADGDPSGETIATMEGDDESDSGDAGAASETSTPGDGQAAEDSPDEPDQPTPEMLQE
jgi:hypothetical protein